MEYFFKYFSEHNAFSLVKIYVINRRFTSLKTMLQVAEKVILLSLGEGGVGIIIPCNDCLIVDSYLWKLKNHCQIENWVKALKRVFQKKNPIEMYF